MFEEFKASAETIASWNDMARRVGDAFDAAGLPSHFMGDYPNPSGVEIEVDSGDDDMGGVIVGWRCGSALTEIVMEQTSNGLTDTPEVKLFGSVTESMRDAMVIILRASGFNVTPLNGSMRPPALRVDD